MLTLNQSKAQIDTLQIHSHQKIIVSISAGIAVPTGKFSYYELDSLINTRNMAGIASTGYNTKFQAIYLLSKSIGVSCIIYSSVNKSNAVDSAALFYDPYPYSHGLGGGFVMLSYNYQTESWDTRGVLIGLVAVVNKDNPNLKFRLSGGMQRVNSPESRLTKIGYN